MSRSQSPNRLRIEKTYERVPSGDACGRSKYQYPGGGSFLLREGPALQFSFLVNFTHDRVPLGIVSKRAGGAQDSLTPCPRGRANRHLESHLLAVGKAQVFG